MKHGSKIKKHIAAALKKIQRREDLSWRGIGDMGFDEYQFIKTELLAIRRILNLETRKPGIAGLVFLFLLASWLPAFIPSASAGTKAKAVVATKTAKTMAAATPQVLPQNFTVGLIDTVNDASSLESHILKWGTASGNYTDHFTVAEPAMTHDFVNFAAGRWYVALTAKNKAGVESPPSSEVVLDVLATPSAPGGMKFTPAPGLVNVSARAKIGTGDDVLISGLILTTPKTVAVRAIGPSLANAGIKGALAKTTLELRYAAGVLVKKNTGWKTGPDAALLTKIALAPSSPNESALIASLPKGSYTAIVRGPGGETGVGLMETFQLQ